MLLVCNFASARIVVYAEECQTTEREKKYDRQIR